MNKNDIKIEEVNSNQVKENYKLKLVVVGDSGVGKTNLIKRFVSDEFIPNSKATVGVEFVSRSYKINEEVFKIEIWDTAGQERYKSITSAYYRGAKGALLVYDVTEKKSFQNIDKWMGEIKEKSSKDINIMIIGNKIDLNDTKAVTTEEAMTKAKTLGVALMEASALNSTNVKEAFYDLLREMYQDVRKKLNIVENTMTNENDGIQLETKEGQEEEKKKGCCS